MAAIFFEHFVGKDAKVNDPATILFFRDHLTFLDEVISEEKKKMGLLDLAGQLKLKQEDFAAKQGIRLHGELKDRKGSEGICHSIVAETYALPGQLNVGSDSHTPHVGAMGCVAFGIGTTDVFNSWITKDVRVKVPESVKVIVRGKRKPNVTAKDFILQDAEPGVHAQRQGAGQGDGVFRRGHRGTERGRARHHDEYGGGDRRLYRHCCARPEGGGVPDGASRHGSRAKRRSIDRRPVQRSGRAVRARDRTRMPPRLRRWWRRRAIRAMASLSAN